MSFADRVEVRVIPGKKNDQDESHTPIPHDSLPDPHHLTNENIYPGASNNRRRSSARFSIADSEDMDLTSVAPSAFPPMNHSALADEEFDYDDNSGMDMTEVIHGDLIRKRSLSMGTRLPLSQISYTTNQEPSQESFEEDESQADSEVASDQSQVMEFTIPLNRSLRSPAQHDETWLALRQATHSGDTPIEPELSSDDFESSNIVHAGDEMDLDDAVQRLMRARKSLPSIPSIESGGIIYGQSQDETFSSMEDSFEDDGNRTINVSKVFGRPSTDGLRIGMESTMEETESYGVIGGPANSTPPPPLPNEATKALGNSAPRVFEPPPAPLPPDRLPVFSAPSEQRQITTPEQSSFHPKESALPQALTRRPSSPSKTKPTLQHQFSISSNPPVASSPQKRPLPNDNTVSRPRPFKQVAAATHQSASVDNGTSSQSSPKPLSPSKKAPFQVPGARTGSRPSALRRPSGYLARRKSLGFGLSPREETHPPARSSPKKKAGLGLGRASLGSGSSDAWSRFNKTRGFDGTEKEFPPCEREAIHQGLASPTRTRGSPSPAPQRLSSPASASTAPAQPLLAVVADISALQMPQDAEDEDEDMMEQWRKGVELTEPDEVGFFLITLMVNDAETSYTACDIHSTILRDDRGQIHGRNHCTKAFHTSFTPRQTSSTWYRRYFLGRICACHRD